MAGKGTRHRFELSRLEIAGVLAGATAALFVVFLLGMYAGRGLAERPGDAGQQIVRMAVAPAVEQTPGADGDITFDHTLDRGARGDGHAEGPGAHPGAERAVAAAPVETAPAKTRAEVPVVKAPELAPTPYTAEVAAAAKRGAGAAAAAPSATPATKVEQRPTPPATARVAVALAPAAAPTPVARTGAKGDWSVQVSATRDPRTADGVLRRLRGKGYDAFVLKVRRRGETFYRVRVGHYASLEEAQRVVTRLRREPGVPEAFVASD
ncbi:MAG: SPOR domain-containing protein [Deltaproteobacteria bacterium]|nr:SPOR domain-containing protein [Deltaproteobacteria bacterium]